MKEINEWNLDYKQRVQYITTRLKFLTHQWTNNFNLCFNCETPEELSIVEDKLDSLWGTIIDFMRIHNVPIEEITSED